MCARHYRILGLNRYKVIEKQTIQDVEKAWTGWKEKYPEKYEAGFDLVGGPRANPTHILSNQFMEMLISHCIPSPQTLRHLKFTLPIPPAVIESIQSLQNFQTAEKIEDFQEFDTCLTELIATACTNSNPSVNFPTPELMA